MAALLGGDRVVGEHLQLVADRKGAGTKLGVVDARGVQISSASSRGAVWPVAQSSCETA